MKTTKRLVSLALCLLMIAAISIPALAATPGGGVAQPNGLVPIAGYDYISCYSTNQVYYYVVPTSTTYYVGWGYTNGRKTVRLCQAFCKASGYDPQGGMDGWFGDNTEAAIKGAQAYYGLTPDGYCGINTWSAMYGGTGCNVDYQSTVGDDGVIYLIRMYLGQSENLYP